MPDKKQHSADVARKIAHEQVYVDELFARLDHEVTAANERLAEVQKEVDPATPDGDALLRREAEYHGLQAKLDRLNLAQVGLVFGRIDIDAPGDNPTDEGLDRRYIGRMGIDDRADNYRTLLLDWRAPMARPFYLATTAHPEGVTVRRHIRTSGRAVTDVSDEALSTHGTDRASATAAADVGVGGESALLSALDKARTGHMHSIVETIQREQDNIIRDSTRGVMVVEGGPGTGKTAVALHRVAYLLYTYRQRLGSTGVLILGPNTRFLDYISRVLPELGETGVVLSTVGDLFPGVTPTHEESLLSREIKGSAEMVEILREAVRALQRIPEKPVTAKVDQIDLEVTPAMVKASRTRARRSRKPHNDARLVFTEHLVEQLAQQLAEKIGTDPLGGENLLSRADVDQLHDDIDAAPNVAELIDAWWPHVTPQEVLADLLSDENKTAEAAHAYDEETRAALYRPDGTAWTPADAALLDELAQLVGMPAPDAERAAADAEWRERVADAEDALDILASSESTDNDDDLFEAEILSAHDVIDPETLAQRQEARDTRTTAQRARADHTWAYGHVIIDEAQELSPMEWRMVFRRSPSRWMTIVGDTAQTGSPAGVDDWAEALEPFVKNRFRHHALTVNYRTPQPIVDYANELLRAIDPEATPATAVRDGAPVRHVPFGTGESGGTPQPGVYREDDGRLHAIIDAHNAETVKGLEFDHVTVIEPQAIIDASPQGLHNLYVAITRATQTLTIVGGWPQLPADG